MKIAIKYYASVYTQLFFRSIPICLHALSMFSFNYLILTHFSQAINTEYRHIKMEGFIDSIFLLRIVNKILEN